VAEPLECRHAFGIHVLILSTIKIPENGAVMLTAILHTLLVMCRSLAHGRGTHVQAPLGKGPKVAPAGTIPRISRFHTLVGSCGGAVQGQIGHSDIHPICRSEFQDGDR
jgi:hypothetical protein